ncbi:hypothetical protein AB0L65_15025 [Nonomuraea sp. NPDC052116]|uniref:AfsR/SARP family transcriptional regulator n=1 Tax=Nonomuraea sp. NPDC052116 TaxID=3155665 RepID=UPI00343848EF
MEFRVLGPLEVRAGDGRAVALGGARPRAVLARLLVARGTVVSSDALIDDLYAGAPPPSALPTLHSYVSNLRRTHECRAVYTTLLPYSGRISALSAVLCLGPVDWYLALLAAATGRHGTAATHLTALEQQADAAGLHWWRDCAAATREPFHVATSG